MNNQPSPEPLPTKEEAIARMEAVWADLTAVLEKHGVPHLVLGVGIPFEGDNIRMCISYNGSSLALIRHMLNDHKDQLTSHAQHLSKHAQALEETGELFDEVLTSQVAQEQTTSCS